MYECSVAYISACLKRASDPPIDGCEPPCGCWELNSGPLEEQPVLFTTEPSRQPIFPLSCACMYMGARVWVHVYTCDDDTCVHVCNERAC